MEWVEEDFSSSSEDEEAEQGAVRAEMYETHDDWKLGLMGKELRSRLGDRTVKQLPPSLWLRQFLEELMKGNVPPLPPAVAEPGVSPLMEKLASSKKLETMVGRVGLYKFLLQEEMARDGDRMPFIFGEDDSSLFWECVVTEMDFPVYGQESPMMERLRRDLKIVKKPDLRTFQPVRNVREFSKLLWFSWCLGQLDVFYLVPSLSVEVVRMKRACLRGVVLLPRFAQVLSLKDGAGEWLSRKDGDGALTTRVLSFF